MQKLKNEIDNKIKEAEEYVLRIERLGQIFTLDEKEYDKYCDYHNIMNCQCYINSKSIKVYDNYEEYKNEI